MSGEERFADHCRRRCIRPDAQLFYFSAENVNMLSSQLAKIMSRFVFDVTKNFSDLSSARGKAQSDWIYVVSLTWKIKTQTDPLKLCLLWLSFVCIVPRNLLMRKDNGHTVFNRQRYFRKAVVGIYSGGLLNCYICDTTADIFYDTIFTQTFLSICLRIQSLYTSIRAQYLEKHWWKGEIITVLCGLLCPNLKFSKQQQPFWMREIPMCYDSSQMLTSWISARIREHWCFEWQLLRCRW